MPQLTRLFLLAALLFGLPHLVAPAAHAQQAVAPENAGALPRAQPLPPDRTADSFRTLAGFRMELLAAEPLVTDPVAMAYDENGRAYVAEMNDYPYTDPALDEPNAEQRSPAAGRIRLLEDIDGDGRFEKSTIFAEELSWPTGIACYKGGVFVTATPDLLYLKDTDGDGRADVRRIVLSGFRKYNVQAVVNNPQWGLDHWLYVAGGSNGGEIAAPSNPPARPVPLGRNDFRLNPVGDAFEVISGGARFGNTFDDWGNRLICNIRNPAQHPVLPSRYLARNPDLPVVSALYDVAESGDTLPVFRTSPAEPWRVINAARLAADTTRASPRSEMAATGYFTSSSGITIYRGGAYPPEFRGSFFVGEVAGNLVHRQVIEPDGVTFTSRRAEADVEFVTSTDNWFRPVNFVNAPDGTLHVLDMYRETIEHPWSIPDDLKARLDLRSGSDRGRIYRLAPPAFQPPGQPPWLGKASTAQLVATLESPHGWWRDTAHRLIYERQDRAAVEPLHALLRQSSLPLARLHAIWSLQGLGALSDDDLLAALGDSAPALREHAVRLAETRLSSNPVLRRRVLSLADDPQVRVRFQVALSLGEFDPPEAVDALARIARRDGDDTWVRTAVLSSVAGRAAALLSVLVGDSSAAAELPLAMVRSLAQLVGARRDPAELEAALALLASLDGRATVERELLLGLGDGLARKGVALATIAGSTDSPAAAAIARLLDDARRLALDAAAPLDQRRQAVQLLRHAEPAGARTALAALIDSRQPVDLQVEAVRTLSMVRDRQVAPLLVAAYPGLTPAVRGDLIDALLARPERIGVLLDAVEDRTIAASQVPLARRALLMRHADETIRQRATHLFAAQAESPRSEVLAAYQQAAATPGDSRRGEAVLRRECLTCHRLGEQGHDVGPNLSSIRHRSPAELLVHILDPNREVGPNYLEYVVVLVDGRTTTGLIAAETPSSITLRRPEGREETILRRDIEQMATTGQSLMPVGIEQKITRQEMADLIALLLSLSRPAGSEATGR